MSKRGHAKLKDGLSVAEYARRLRAKPGWNPQRFTSGEDLSQTLEQLQTESRLLEQNDCADCKKIQDETDDPQALCRRHFAIVLGF